MTPYLTLTPFLRRLALISSTCGVLACGASDAGSEPEAEPSTPAENDVEPGATGDDTEDPAVSPNGVSPNGVSPNGVSPNGVSPNAVSPNGVSPNGVSPNGGAGATDPCESAERIGSFRFYLGDERTIFSGAISDRPAPTSLREVIATQGTCSLIGPRNHFCSTPCPSGQTCAGEDECVESPKKVSAGGATISGALAAVEANPNAITREYSATLLDPFPGFVPGTAISLSLAGEDTEPFTLSGWGVAPMKTAADVIAVASGSGATLTWDASEADVERSAVYINFTVNAHGAVTGWIECTTEDDGSFEIPEPLVTRLIALGLSGFPRATLGRRSMDKTSLAAGCVDFEVSSEVTIDLEVDGLISCSDDDDCPDGQACSLELACE